jgi:hypothetical protein
VATNTASLNKQVEESEKLSDFILELYEKVEDAVILYQETSAEGYN